MLGFMWGRNITKGDECVEHCFRNSSIPETVIHFFVDVARDVFRRQNSTNIRRLFNATMLDWYCGLDFPRWLNKPNHEAF
uniref:Uncharacterized protein n=1 Tax=Romanomermis culicivorax TaxID=13658 RepID=A0A915IN20_ROMCU